MEYPFAQLGSPVLAVFTPKILTTPGLLVRGECWKDSLGAVPLSYQPVCSTDTQRSTRRAAVGKVKSIPARSIQNSSSSTFIRVPCLLLYQSSSLGIYDLAVA